MTTIEIGKQGASGKSPKPFVLRIGRLDLSVGVQLAPRPLVVIAGPNNSGKTTILRDIHTILTGKSDAGRIVTDIEYSIAPDIAALIRDQYFEINKGDLVGLDAHLSRIKEIPFASFDSNSRRTRTGAAEFLIGYLRTEDRLRLSEPYRASSPSKGGLLAKQLYDLGVPGEEKFRSIFRSMKTGLDIKLDFSSLEACEFRVSDIFPTLPDDPREARQILQRMPKLIDQGDGVRSLAGTVLALLSTKRHIWLIDEPETFLHPPQAFALGAFLADSASNCRQIFIATHSSDVLRGILSKTADLDVIRTTSDRDICRTVAPEIVDSLTRDPILSANRGLDGLFYGATVVVEADSDALFYQRVANRCDLPDDVYWVRAHNKQTLKKIIAPYRALAIPVAAVVDFDILRIKSEFESLLRSVTKEGLDAPLRLRARIVEAIEKRTPGEQLATMRGAIERLLAEFPGLQKEPEHGLETTGRRLQEILDERDAWQNYKRFGRGHLNGTIRAIFDELSAWCETRGIFIVPVGELESWLIEDGIDHPRSKQRWLNPALDFIESQQARDAGPWLFVRRIYEFLLPSLTTEIFRNHGQQSRGVGPSALSDISTEIFRSYEQQSSDIGASAVSGITTETFHSRGQQSRDIGVSAVVDTAGSQSQHKESTADSSLVHKSTAIQPLAHGSSGGILNAIWGWFSCGARRSKK